MFLPLSALSWGYHTIFLPPQIHRKMQTLPHNPATKTMTTQLTMMQRTSNADNDIDVAADNDNPMQTMDNNADNGQQCKQ